MYRELAQYNKQAGNFKKAREIYEDIISKKIDDFDTAFEYLKFLQDNKDYKQMLAIIEQMKASVDEKTGLDGLTRFYHDWCQYSQYHAIISALCVHEAGIEYLQNGYEKAIQAARTQHEAALARADLSEADSMNGVLGLLLYYYGAVIYRLQPPSTTANTAIDILEQSSKIQDDRAQVSYSFASWAKKLAQQQLAVIYTDQARAHDPNSEEAKDLIQRLKGLNGDVSTDVSRSSLGRYYSSIGKQKEAMDALRVDVNNGLELLSDHDPGNDWYGYLTLAEALMHAGQDDNALAAVCYTSTHSFVSMQTDRRKVVPDKTRNDRKRG